MVNYCICGKKRKKATKKRGGKLPAGFRQYIREKSLGQRKDVGAKKRARGVILSPEFRKRQAQNARKAARKKYSK